jgi:NAD(P)-dependent dehydrogenase (short-subunit alcohol dehydrogenase family)
MTPSEIICKTPAIVTGAGGGLGRALAQKLATQGMTVACLGRTEAALVETCAVNGDLLVPYVCDVADAASVREVVAQITETHGAPRLLINNAAIDPKRDVLDMPAGGFMETVAVNLGGVANLVEAVLPGMVAEGDMAGIGRILNVATFADMSPLPMSAEYSTSKGAARIYTRALIADIGDRFPDIVVGDWMPGMLATQMGIADGLKPEVAAGWGAALALMHDPDLTGTTFEMDREILSGSGLKRRIKAALTFRRLAQARRITPI